MKTPFTADQFLDVFRQYNETVFPVQFLLILSALTAVYFAFNPKPSSSKWTSVILALLWLWMGIAYHLIFFSSINKAAMLFGAMFIIQGLLFLYNGVFRNKLDFSFHTDLYGWTGLSLIIFALLVYPVLGYFFGHMYPTSPTFGLPCPTTIFTFGMLLLTSKRCPLSLLIIPFIWSIIGFTAAFSFGILEDTGLLVAGLITVPLILKKNKAFKA